MPKPNPVIYDTTLRDGAQALGVNFSPSGKIRFAHLLDEFGIPLLEGGFAGSNERDMQFFRDVRGECFSQIRFAAFGSTRRAGSKAADDPFLQAILRAEAPVAAIYGKCWRLHVREVLRTTDEENIDMVAESVAFLREHGLEVVFDAEHFFDGFADDPEYALAVLSAAAQAGASYLVLCDTNGGSLPWRISAALERVRARVQDVALGIHAHNDAGLAVANSLAAFEAGAAMIQGCINGYGERAGNANLVSIIPTLQLKLGACVTSPEKLAGLRALSLEVDDLVNQRPDIRAPYVGEAAFSHKAGAHVSGVRHNPSSFEHVPPETVGNERHVLLSELSGASNVLWRLKESGQGDLPREQVAKVVAALKAREAEGCTFESADASFRILVRKALDEHRPFFNLESFRVTIERRGGDASCRSEATIKLRVGGRVELTAGEGEGPVEALDQALRKALSAFYPEIAKVVLTDFRVRILDPKDAASAATRVLIESTDGDSRWTTVGVSPNIIEASWQALLDSVEYKLLKDGAEPPPAQPL